jgi:hypothetical protein
VFTHAKIEQLFLKTSIYSDELWYIGAKPHSGAKRTF